MVRTGYNPKPKIFLPKNDLDPKFVGTYNFFETKKNLESTNFFEPRFVEPKFFFTSNFSRVKISKTQFFFTEYFHDLIFLFHLKHFWTNNFQYKIR